MVYIDSCNVPYVQFESVGDFILEHSAQSLLWGYKRKGERWGLQTARSDSGLKGRELRELRYVLSVRACARVFESSGSVVVCE